MDELATIFVTITIAPAIATVVCMVFTWVIFVYNVDRVVKVRTGEEDFAALQDVE